MTRMMDLMILRRHFTIILLGSILFLSIILTCYSCENGGGVETYYFRNFSVDFSDFDLHIYKRPDGSMDHSFGLVDSIFGVHFIISSSEDDIIRDFNQIASDHHLICSPQDKWPENYYRLSEYVSFQEGLLEHVVLQYRVEEDGSYPEVTKISRHGDKVCSVLSMAKRSYRTISEMFAFRDRVDGSVTIRK